MANKLALAFQAVFRSDGSSTSVVVTLATSPVGYSPPGTSPQLSDINLAAATDAVDLAADWDATVTKTSLLAGVLTLGISTVPAINEMHTIYGKLLF